MDSINASTISTQSASELSLMDVETSSQTSMSEVLSLSELIGSENAEEIEQDIVAVNENDWVVAGTYHTTEKDRVEVMIRLGRGESINSIALA